MPLCAPQYWVKIVHAIQQLCGHCRTTRGEKCNHIQHNSISRNLQVEQGQPSDSIDSHGSCSLPLSGKCHPASHTVSQSHPPPSFLWHCALNHLPCQLFKAPQLGASVRRARSSALLSAQGESKLLQNFYFQCLNPTIGLHCQPLDVLRNSQSTDFLKK